MRHKWLLSLLVIAILLGITLAILPLAMQRLAVTWLEQNGADRAAIGNIDLNIFTGRLGVFDVEVEKEGEKPLRIWRLTADVDWWPLSRKRFFVKAVWLYDAELLINQREDGGLEIGGIRLAPEYRAGSKSPTESGSSGFLERWGVGINSFAIRNSTIRYRSTMFDERLDINSLYVLNAFSWQPDNPARINFDLLLNNQPVTLSSDTRFFRSKPDSSSTLRIADLDLSHYEPLAKQAGIDELQGLLSLSLVFDTVYENHNQAHFTLDANVNISDFRMRQGDLLVEDKGLQYQTKARLNLPATVGQELGTADGQLVIQNQAVTISNYRANFSQLVWDGDATITAGNVSDAPFNTLIRGNVEVANLLIDDQKAGLKLAIVKKAAAKEISVALPGDVQVGEITLNDIKALQQTDSDLEPGLPEIGIKQADFRDARLINAKQLATIASIDLASLSAQTADKKLQLARVQTLNVEQAAVKLQEIASVKSLVLTDAQALKPLNSTDSANPEPAVRVSRTRLDNLQFQFEPQSMLVESIDIDALNVLAKRQTDGSLYAINLLPTVTTEAPSAQTSTPGDEKSGAHFTLKLDKIDMGKDSAIHIVDQTVTPHFDAHITPLNLTVEKIDNTKPSTQTKFDLNLSLNPGNHIAVNGWITPFAVKHDADIKVDIQALDLVMFSPYSVQAAGYQVNSGRVNATLIGKIHDDMVNANTKLLAQRLKLDAISEKARGESAQRLGIGMPIDAALAMMKDKKGDITIEVPISGNLEDPDFAFGPALRGAMTQAIKKASVTYATYALQPYGSILFGAQMLSKAMALRLESVRFAPGEVELNDKAKKYLNKIADLMNDRPGISITLCGSATESDRKILRQRNVNKLEEELALLADKRGEQVKDHLIKQYGIAAERFFNCQPEVSSDEAAQPEVRLGL